MSETTNITDAPSAKAKRTRKPAASESTEGGTLQRLLNDQLQASGREQAKAPASKPAAKAKKSAMGPSGYRAKYGSSDDEMVKAVSAWLKVGKRKAMPKAQILEIIGWALKPESAISKVRAHLDAN
jgi:hypothetical protein